MGKVVKGSEEEEEETDDEASSSSSNATDTFYLGKVVKGGEEKTEEPNSQGVRAGAEEEAEGGEVEESALLKPNETYYSATSDLLIMYLCKKVEEPALLRPSKSLRPSKRAVASCLGGREGGEGFLPENNACATNNARGFTYRMPYKWGKGVSE